MVNRRIQSITMHQNENINHGKVGEHPYVLLYFTTARYIRENHITKFARRPFVGAKRLTFVVKNDWFGIKAFACVENSTLFLCIKLCREYGIVAEHTNKFSLWFK